VGNQWAIDPAAQRTNPRAAAISDLFAHAARLAAAGDLAGARTMSEAATRLLADPATTSNVVDLATKRRDRREP
jgi:hypothetical protein